MTGYFEKFFRVHPVKSRRGLQMLPGIFSWTMILLPIWGSILIPLQVTYFILAFDIFFFTRSFSLVFTSYMGSKRIREAESKNWLEIAKQNQDFDNVEHIVVLPNYQENVTKLKRLIGTIANQSFPTKKIHIVLAMEKREKDAKQKAQEIINEFNGVFGNVIATFHPDIIGEVKGKSSNEAYGGKYFYKNFVKNGKINMDFATITTADADAMFDPQYFSYLANSFLTDPKKYLRFWQSANVDHNNFWTVPAPNRVLSFFSSLWRTGMLVQGDRLIANAVYSLSLKLLVGIGFWDTDVIPEDYRVYFKAFYKTRGQVSANPIFLKTTLDVPQSTSYLKSVKVKYLQQRRWSYGASDDPLFIEWWLTVPGIPFVRKTKMLFHVLMDHFLWPVNWFIITISANLITLVNPNFARTQIGYTLPIIARLILSTTLIALLIMIIIDYRNRPKHISKSRLREVLFPLEFVLMPIVGFFLNSLPALISHTQIMFNKKMEYKVTEKV